MANYLHEHKFVSFLVDVPSDIAQARHCSCAGLGASVWLLTHPTTLVFHLSLAHFLTTLRTDLSLPHPSVAHLSQCQCGHTIDDLSTHLLQCPCGSECIAAHDTLRDIVIAIALENKTHVQTKVFYLFLHHI